MTRDASDKGSLESFATPRLLAERVTAAHWLDLRRMDEDDSFMARLGGPRDVDGTVAYLRMNMKHWADHGFGMWMLRDAGSKAVIGRAILQLKNTDLLTPDYRLLRFYSGSAPTGSTVSFEPGITGFSLCPEQ